MSDIIELYDYELAIINDLHTRIHHKYANEVISADLFRRMEDEVVSRFYDIGYRVELEYVNHVLDITNNVDPPTPVTISVIGRVNPIGVGEFDYEKKTHEVRKNGSTPRG